MVQAAHTPATGSDANDWKVIALVSSAHAGSHFFQLVIPSLYVALAAAFDLDFARLGLLMSVFFVLSGIGQASSGFVVDRIGARPVLWFGQACFVVSALLLAAAPSYLMLLVAAAVGGLGNSVFHPADFSILNHRVSQPRLGHAFSMHGLSGSLGWAAAPMFVAGITFVAGWRMAALGVAILLAVILLATIAWGRLLGSAGEDAAEKVVSTDKSTSRNKAPEGVWATVIALSANPALWGAFLFFAMTSVALSAIQNYTLPILGGLYQISEIVASSALSGYMLASAVGMFAGGFLASSQPHTEKVVGISLLVGGGLLMLLALGWVPSGLAILTVALSGLCSGIAGPSRDMLIRRVTPKGAMGSVYGLVYSGMDLGAACAPLMFGLMMDAGMMHGPWVGAAVAWWIAAVLAARIAILANRNERLATA